MFREGISTLPPGKEIRALFDAGPARHEAGLPDLYEVTVTYRDQSGKKEYEENIDLDFGLYWNRVYITVRDVHDLHKELEGIRREIKKWTANIGGGLLQVTPADLEARIDDLRQQFEERRQEEEEE